MRVREVSAEDAEAWDGFVRSRADASPFHLYGWGLAIRDAYGHPPIYLAAEDDRSSICGVLPLCRFRTPFRKPRFVSLPFCDLGGVVSDGEAVRDELLTNARKLAADAGARCVQLRQAQAADRPAGAVPVAADKVRMILPLPGSSDELLASFKSKLRSQVHKAAKNGMEFAWVGSEGVGEFYEIFSRNMRDLGSPVHGRRLYEAILNRLPESARIGVVRFQGQPVAAGLVLALAKHRLTIPWASSLRSHNQLAPNMWLYWNLLQHAAEEGFAEFDFGRSTLSEGTYRFKAQWGAHPVPLGWGDLGAEPSSSPVTLRSTAASERQQLESSGPGAVRSAVEGIWKKLPLPLANWVGPGLRRYIDL